MFVTRGNDGLYYEREGWVQLQKPRDRGCDIDCYHEWLVESWLGVL